MNASDRILGIVLFVPVPLVLWLFTRQPDALGPLGSLGLGVVLMATHRLYARPFARAGAARRCLWCGGAAGDGSITLEVDEPPGRTAWRACSAPHAARLANTFGWAAARARFVKLGIGGSLAVFLIGTLLAGLHKAGPLVAGDFVALFRGGVALTVLPLGWLGPSRGHAVAGAPPRVPFPVHIQALIGTWAVLWLFRLIGIVWLGQAAWWFVRRVAGT